MPTRVEVLYKASGGATKYLVQQLLSSCYPGKIFLFAEELNNYEIKRQLIQKLCFPIIFEVLENFFARCIISS